jgi:hypothetical protein
MNEGARRRPDRGIRNPASTWRRSGYTLSILGRLRRVDTNDVKSMWQISNVEGLCRNQPCSQDT